MGPVLSVDYRTLTARAGTAGLLWSLWWEQVMAGIKESEPEVASRLVSEPHEQSTAAGAPRITPWRGFMRSGPVRSGPSRCQGIRAAHRDLASICLSAPLR